jgi:mono/diheme cytochrome c family protein
MRLLVPSCLAFVSVVLVSVQAAGPQGPPSNAIAPAPAVSTQRAVLDKYCVGCHNERLKTANLLLDKFDLARLSDHAAEAEKIVRKLRAGMMPPGGMPRPDPATREALIGWLEKELDRNALASPSLPPPGLHRLNRTEYTNAIRDLLGLHIDAATFLPPDDSTNGFDNMAKALGMSPALMEAYLSAAGKISRLAMGSESAPSQVEFNVPEGTSQMYHVEGLPFGTRGGILIKHEFPADGEYLFKVVPVNEGNMGQANRPFGAVPGQKLEVTIDGERVHLFDWDKDMVGFAVRFGVPSPPIRVKAGLHTVGVTFLATHFSPNNHDTNYSFLRSTLETSGIQGHVFFPHVGRVRIEGPFNAPASSDTPSRRKILACRPVNENDEEPCARQTLSALARRAYRRPVTPSDVGTLMEFYSLGRKGGTFEHGVEMALARLLVDTEFVYRGESEPANLAPGTSYRISDLELASRLSFFLWSSIPDDELMNLAVQSRLRNPAVLEQQVRRMLADPRSEALVSNFTGQWLNVRALRDVQPIASLYPDFDDTLRLAFQREVELFFASIVREDRSILDLLTADYTFANERLALHYGIPNVYGSQFRRIALGPEHDVRRGLLGKGALLTVTSQPARTSPVARGKWFLQTFLGVSPPDPPPVVPPVKPKVEDAAGNTKAPTMRQVMEEHRTNPVCASCHKIFDPIGFSLENFDAVGTWRTQDEGTPVDPSGVLGDGTTLTGVASLRDLLVRYSDQFVRVVTEKMLTYALGRGVEYPDMPVVRSIVHGAAASNYRFSSLVMGIVKSAPFQMSTKPLGPAQPAAGSTQQAAR